MNADDCARIIEGVAAVLDLLAERCRHVRVALEVMTGCE